MSTAKISVPLLRSREHAEKIAVIVVRAEEEISTLQAQCKAELDAVKEQYAAQIAALRKTHTANRDGLERWAAGDAPNWRDAEGRPRRSIVFDNGVELAFRDAGCHVEPTPQQRRDGALILAILGTDSLDGSELDAESPDPDRDAAREILSNTTVEISIGEHARLAKRYLRIVRSLDRDEILRVLTTTEPRSPSELRDRVLLGELGFATAENESFLVRRAERQPSAS